MIRNHASFDIFQTFWRLKILAVSRLFLFARLRKTSKLKYKFSETWNCTQFLHSTISVFFKQITLSKKKILNIHVYSIAQSCSIYQVDSTTIKPVLHFKQTKNTLMNLKHPFIKTWTLQIWLLCPNCEPKLWIKDNLKIPRNLNNLEKAKIAPEYVWGTEEIE